MARPLSDSHRRIAIGLLGQYVGADHRCLRDVVGWLVAGPDSTRTGLMRIHVGSLVDDLGWSKPQVVAALNRLQAEGLIIWHEPLRIVLCWFVLRTVTVSVENHRKSYIAQCQTFADCLARSEAIKALQAIVIVSRDGASKAPSHGASHGALGGASHSTSQDSGFRIQDSGSFTVAKATVPPAVADGAAPMSSGEQASEQAPPTRSRYLSFDPDWKPTVRPELLTDTQPQPAPKAAKLKSEPKDKARPTFAEAVAYFREEGSTELEACKFCDYHDAGGWKIGRNPMKDWRAAARNWMRNATQYAPARGKTGRGPAGKEWPTVEATAPASHVLDFDDTPASSQADSWAEAEALKVWRKGGKVGPAPPSGGKRADYAQWLEQ